MDKYTVVLLYPERLCDDVPYGQEIYAASIEAGALRAAVQAAQQEAAIVYNKDYGCDRNDRAYPDEFKLVAVFEGHHEPVLFGWQL